MTQGNDIASRAIRFIESGFEDRAALKVDKIQKLMVEASLKAYKVMALMGVGVDSTPDFGEFTKPWKPLDPEHDYGILYPKFYLKTGALGGLLSRKSTKSSLGTPIIRFRPAQMGGGVSASMETWRGHGSKRNVVRNAKGQFVSKSVASRIAARFEFNMFPKVDLDTVSPGDLFNAESAYKLTNTRGKTTRPLVNPFLNWYAKTEANNAINKGLRS